MFSMLIPKFAISKSHKSFKNAVKPSNNRVQPLQEQFRSTKDMLYYAKKRCVDAINRDNPYEHVVVMDIKKNRVLAEFAGDKHSCNLDGLKNMDIDKESTVLAHSHTVPTPVSPPDINTLITYNINQIIAFDSKGRFSLVARKIDMPTDVSKEFKNFRDEHIDLTDGMFREKNCDLYCTASDYVLKKHAPLMGLRYISSFL